MRIRRIFISSPVTAGSILTLPEETAHYLGNVLRLRNGTPVRIFDGRGGEFNAKVGEHGKRLVTLSVADHLDQEKESPLAVTMALGISRGERMDYAVQKAVELGAARIVPLTTEHCAVQLDSRRAGQKLNHWRKVVTSACEQCGRNRLPELRPVIGFHAWASGVTGGVRLVFSPAAGRKLSGVSKPDGPATILLGPEGGLSEDEVHTAIQAGFLPIALGPRILRAETAAVAALTAVQVLWGDL